MLSKSIVYRKIIRPIHYRVTYGAIAKFFDGNVDFRQFSKHEYHRAVLWYLATNSLSYALYRAMYLWGVDSLTDSEYQEIGLQV